VFTGYERATKPGIAQFGFAKADRRVSVFYFYVWDDDFGPGFIKLCTYLQAATEPGVVAIGVAHLLPVSGQGVGQWPCAPRGAMNTSGDERAPPPGCRSSLVKLRAA